MLSGMTKEKYKKIANQLDQALKMLKRNKAEIIVIACNTLHGFLKKDYNDLFRY